MIFQIIVKTAWNGREGEFGKFLFDIYLVAFAPLVFLLDLLHFFLGEVVFDVEVLNQR